MYVPTADYQPRPNRSHRVEPEISASLGALGGTWRMRPPNRHQGLNTCWAAAISSWSLVTRGAPNLRTVADVRALFRSWDPALINPDGSLRTVPGFRRFAGELGLRIEEVLLSGTPTPGIKVTRASDLEQKHFAPKLRRNHVITVVGVDPPRRLNHVVVVYGVDKFSICYMDPLLDPILRPCTKRSRGRCESRECDRYHDFPSTFGPGPRYLLIWK